MSVKKLPVLHHNIDHLAMRPGVLHCWGWVCAEDGPLRALHLVCRLQDDRLVEYPVEYGALRTDVGDALKHLPHAAASGFLANVAWQGAELHSAWLRATTENMQCVNIALIDGVPDAPQAPSKLKPTVQMGWQLGLRALRLMRRGQFAVLYEKARRYLAAKPVEVDDPVEQIRLGLESVQKTRALLVIDHDLGGGAPLYRQRLIAAHVEKGGAVLLLTFHLPTVSYAVQVYGGMNFPRLALQRLVDLMPLAREGWIGDVFFNNAVSFPEPQRLPEFLSALRMASAGRVTLAFHDYYLLCPSHFLLDDAGKFCDIPDVQRCAKCLPNNREGFVNFYPARDIVLWRKNWGKLIDSADEILFFSKSSQEIFLRVYPNFPASKMRVRPHAMDYFPHRQLAVDLAAPLHIGVVGHIGRHKGAKIIASLAKEMAAKRPEVRMTIFGQIDEFVPRGVVRVTGSYTSEMLPELIETSGANLMLMPSIYPETFSFVTHEIIELGLPVVCFDLGAQAEAVSGYSKGRVIPLMEGEALLNMLCEVKTEFFDDADAKQI